MVYIYGYLERDNDKVSKFHKNNFFLLWNKRLPFLSTELQ